MRVFSVLSVISNTYQRSAEHMEWDLAWASDPVFSHDTDKSSCIPCLEPQFVHLLKGIIILSAQ